MYIQFAKEVQLCYMYTIVLFSALPCSNIANMDYHALNQALPTMMRGAPLSIWVDY